MNVTIVGGGNIGTQFAVHCAQKNNKVIIYTSKPDTFSKELSIVNEEGKIIHSGIIDLATSDSKQAFESADLIFVTMPAYCMKDIAEKILPHIKKGVKIGLIPGTGGGECAFRTCIEKGAIIFGLQRVPSVARLVEYGKQVCATGYRDELFLSSIPNKYTNDLCKKISSIFDMKCSSLPNYLNLTLTPSNPILHTTRLKNIFKDYSEGIVYDKLPLFYEDWNDETSRLLFKCDDEVQKICNKIGEFDLSYVKSLKIHYESETPELLTKKISSIQSFKGLQTPHCVTDNGKYIPDLNSRYFTADFSYGLFIIEQIADFLGIDVPNIKSTMDWYRNISINKSEFCFKDNGIFSYKDFIEFYKK